MNWHQKKTNLRFWGAGILAFLMLIIGVQSNTFAFTDPPTDPKPQIDAEHEGQLVIEESMIVNEELYKILNSKAVAGEGEPLSEGSTTAGWSIIKTETFEGIWPGAGWTVWDGDGATWGEYYWDDDDYRPYTGSYSAWSANGGANGVDPAIWGYPHLADSWMAYGPFNLSIADDAFVDFYYWNQSELYFDYFWWLVSIDGGSTWYGSSVSGDLQGWKN